MEKSLHSLLPSVSASILSFHLSRLLMDYWGVDRVATLFPYLFALFMAAGMLSLGCTPSSFVPQDDTLMSSFSISSLAARGHSVLLLLVPGTMHCLMFRQRILSKHAATDELYDLILVWTVPYLLHCGVLWLHSSKSPYTMARLFPEMRENTLRGTLVPMGLSLLSSLAAQQQYVIPLCNKVSYQFNGHDSPATWIVSTYLTSATFSVLFAVWTWGRKSSVTGEVLFGEYHEDIVQLAISASGLLLGRAFGFPWNLTPLPILAFLGLSVWVTTRMLRYLAIFLFVLHAGSVVLFSYRFASIDITIPLAIPGIQVNLIRFGTIEVMSSVFIALVAGFAVRPPGGFGSAFLKRVDVAGILLIAYELLLTALEITLLKRPVPSEMVGQESDVGVEDIDFLYDHATALLTSIAIVVVTIITQRLKIISAKASIVALSLGIAKALSVIVDANESADGKNRTEAKQEQLAQRLFYRTMVAAFLLIVMMAPRVLLQPIHFKTSVRHKRSLADGKPIGSIPSSAVRNIVAYTMVILPASLLSAVPMVLTPLAMVVSSHYGGGAYYKVAPPLSEMAGFALTLWGIASLSMLSYYLPDGGAETWKKASALTLLMGIGVTFSAPTVPDWIAGDRGLGVSNPYASISSLGVKLVSQGRNRTGGWGILSASFATLLAVTGPLELRERKHPSGRKDQFLLLRLMIFSILFGSGVSWFIAIQSMGQEKFFELLMTALACMVVSFFGTVTCVLGYFLELENFEEVDQMAKIWLGAFGLFGLVTGAPTIFVASSNMHAFGAGGWLATYLAVSSLAAFSLTMALKLRSTKNQATVGLGNASCILSYVFAILVLYGRYGVSGMDDTFAVTTVFGVPVSILGTFLVAPMLLALEGESRGERPSRVSRISTGSSKPPARTIGLTLHQLSASNRFAPPVAATFAVFVLAGLYAIFLRGSFLFPSVATSHRDLFMKVKGSDTLAQLAQRSMTHSVSLKIAARMAGSSVWTASNPLGPLIHLGGLVATAPSIVLVISQMWTGSKAAKAQVIVCLPVNLIPLLFCRGIPPIPAAASVGAIGGLLQVFYVHRSDRRSQMRI